jgi:hypothetical protein
MQETRMISATLYLTRNGFDFAEQKIRLLEKLDDRALILCESPTSLCSRFARRTSANS